MSESLSEIGDNVKSHPISDGNNGPLQSGCPDAATNVSCHKGTLTGVLNGTKKEISHEKLSATVTELLQTFALDASQRPGSHPDLQDLTFNFPEQVGKDKDSPSTESPCSSSKVASSQNVTGVGENCLDDEVPSTSSAELNVDGVKICSYVDETQMPAIMRLIAKDLSEPYSIYTYRYFIHKWPQLCFLARLRGEYVGAIVCKIDSSCKGIRRGYIAMLAVDESARRCGVGTQLVRRSILVMKMSNCDEVVLEAEVTNKAALRLYEKLGFVRDKRLFRYYLNGVDAFRLKLFLSHNPLVRGFGRAY